MSWWDNGAKKDEGSFNSGVIVGEWKGWYNNGKLNYSGKYNSIGKKNGKWMYWHETGQPREECGYVNGIKHGSYKQWFDKGMFVDTQGKYKKGHQHGEWKYFYETGGINKIQHFKNGKLSGKCLSYYTNAKLQSVTNYKIIKDFRKGKVQSVADGEWVFYDKSGKEISRINYHNGVRK
jgi:antitoxin component YwqK of YwqJK toxin-antitoxin module